MNHKRLFYGWWLALAANLIFFTLAANPFRIILKELIAEFGYGRGMVSLASSTATIAGGIAGLFIGKLVIKHSPKKFLFAGIIGSGLTYFALSLSPNLWYLYAFFFISGVMMAAAGVIPLFTILSRWFKRKWGTAVGIAITGFALGSMVLSPVIGVIMEHYGWRATFIFGGILFFVVDLPLLVWVIKDDPSSLGLLPDGDEPSPLLSAPISASVSRTEDTVSANPFYYLKKGRVWLIGLCFALASIGDMAVTQHQVAFITDMGISATVAATALGFTLGLSGAGQVLSGWLADRIHSRYVSIFFNLVALGGILVLIGAKDMSRIWLFVIIYGLGTGASSTLLPLVITDAFGAAGFSVIFSVLDIFYKMGSIVGTPMAGFIFDATGSYQQVFFIVTVMYFLAMVSVYLAFKPDPRPFWKRQRK